MDQDDTERDTSDAAPARPRPRGTATDGRPYVVVLAVAPWATTSAIGPSSVASVPARI